MISGDDVIMKVPLHGDEHAVRPIVERPIKYLIIGIVCLVALPVGSSFCEVRSTTQVDSASSLIALFGNPPAEYNSAPFLAWNGELIEADIERQIADYHSQHIRAFFIHARAGLITSYLSERWFELERYTVGESEDARDGRMDLRRGLLSEGVRRAVMLQPKCQNRGTRNRA